MREGFAIGVTALVSFARRVLTIPMSPSGERYSLEAGPLCALCGIPLCGHRLVHARIVEFRETVHRTFVYNTCWVP